MNQKIFVDLRNILANFYPDEPSIRRIIADSGIDSSRVVLTAIAINCWHSVLVEAEKIDLVDALLSVVEREYGRNKKFQNVCDTYHEQNNGPKYKTLEPPLSEFDPHILKQLSAPGGGMKPQDTLYVTRDADLSLLWQLVNKGTTTTIQAPRQTGKTSLLVRGIHAAVEQGVNVVYLDFQSCVGEQLASFDTFLYELAESICNEIELDEYILDHAWQGRQSSAKKLTRFIEKVVLPTFERPFVLAIDEADSLLERTNFHKDFFSLIRSWHNRRAHREIWTKCNIVLVISTEPYLLIDDINQSPFNVGYSIYLTDFSHEQVHILNQQHGSPLDDSEIPEFMALLQGHPYLTRQALFTMVNERLDWTQLETRAFSARGPFTNHLNHQFSILHKNTPLINALKEIIRTARCSDATALFRLMQAGLVKGTGEVYSCRCDLYKTFFEATLFY